MRAKILPAAIVGALVATLLGGGAGFALESSDADPAPSSNDTVATPGSPSLEAPDGEAIELDWDALIPTEWRPDKLMEEYGAQELADDDPRAIELFEKLIRLWKEAPVVAHFNGKTVKLPGFVVPLETDGTRISEFLLVPYFGACIHVPPPPANQTVYVVTKKGEEYQGQLFDAVWVTGQLNVQSTRSDLADAGYMISAHTVELYE